MVKMIRILASFQLDRTQQDLGQSHWENFN